MCLDLIRCELLSFTFQSPKVPAVFPPLGKVKDFGFKVDEIQFENKVFSLQRPSFNILDSINSELLFLADNDVKSDLTIGTKSSNHIHSTENGLNIKRSPQTAAI